MRTGCGIAAAAAAMVTWRAQLVLASVPIILPVMDLWPNGPAPYAQGHGIADRPRLELPAAPPPTDSRIRSAAVIYIPGGRYVSYGESVVPQLLYPGILDSAADSVFFTLFYRLAPYRYPVELVDAHRAVRLVGSRAPLYRFDPSRVVLVGLSVGGHLASMAATLPVDLDALDWSDPVDALYSSLPDALALFAPITLWYGRFRDPFVASALLGPLKSTEPAELMAVSTCDFVQATTPPTFLFHCEHDPVVSVGNSDCFYAALQMRAVDATYWRADCAHHVPTDLVTGVLNSSVTAFIRDFVRRTSPSRQPSAAPSSEPSRQPSAAPSSEPTSSFPSPPPSPAPSRSPTSRSPVTHRPVTSKHPSARPTWYTPSSAPSANGSLAS